MGTRTAKSCGPGISTLISSCAKEVSRSDGDNKADHRGEHEAAVTPLRRECRMMRRTCGDYACVLFYLHTRLRVQRAPGIPCALLIRGILKLGRSLRGGTLF